GKSGLFIKLVFVNVSGWITKSDFEFDSVLVQPGEEVTLLCSNLTNVFQHIFWYKLIPGPGVSRISSMVNPGSKAHLHDGFQREKFNMTSNGTNIFLNIKQVNFSDSGVYICGTKSPSCLKIFSETYLQVEVDLETSLLYCAEYIIYVFVSVVDGLDGVNLPTVILGGVGIFLVIIILGLVLKTKPCHAVTASLFFFFALQNLDSDLVNYAALNFRPKANRKRRPSAEREMDPNVVYAAPR
uniref:Ig-like domain-containing protein n=1 Tax=Xiphophorus couchianus TaxID=32473 RepID=A0A3B5L4R3_9TELE